MMRHRERWRIRAAAGFGAGLFVSTLLAADGATPSPLAARCAPLSVRDVRPGMTFAQVREKLGANGVTSRLRDGDAEAGAVEYVAGGSPVYVLYDRPVDRKPADARVVLIRGAAPRRGASMAMLTRKLGAPADGALSESGALVSEAALWVEPECGLVARLYRRGTSWWAEGSDLVFEVESVDRALRGDTADAAVVSEVMEAYAKAKAAPPIPPELSLALGIEETTPRAGGVPSERGSTIAPARRVRFVAPEYPPAAKALGIHGKTILAVEVAEDGKVGKIRVLSAQPAGRGFEEAAVKAARRWVYEPAVEDGKPVASEVTVLVNFD